jgi:3-oxoacyl-[acyl-carrier protein] reductase
MTALVTGASGGIGSAIAMASRQRGWPVNNGDKPRRRAGGGDHVALQWICRTARRSMLVPRTVEALGRSTYWSTTPGSLATICHADEGRGMVRVIRVNLEAAFRSRAPR